MTATCVPVQSQFFSSLQLHKAFAHLVQGLQAQRLVTGSFTVQLPLLSAPSTRSFPPSLWWFLPIHISWPIPPLLQTSHSQW